MPELPLQHWHERPWLTCLEVQAVMLFPGDTVWREDYVTRGREYWKIEQELEESNISDFARSMIQSYYEHSVNLEILEAAKKGDIAGRILAIIYLDQTMGNSETSCWPNGTDNPNFRADHLGRGSVGRAKAAINDPEATINEHADPHAKEFKPDLYPYWGRLNFNMKQLDRAWSQYKFVSPLWAAIALTTSGQRITDYPTLGIAFQLFISPKMLPGFLGFAEHLQQFAEKLKPHAQKGQQLLSPKDMWAIPKSFPIVPYDPALGLPPLNSKTLKALAAYRAERK
jgi:hypothetical protein